MEPSSASPDKAIWHVKSSVYGHIISGNKAEERTCYTPHLVQTASTHSVHAGSTSTKQLLTTALIPSLFLLWSRLRWGLHHAKTSFILKVYHPPRALCSIAWLLWVMQVPWSARGHNPKPPLPFPTHKRTGKPLDILLARHLLPYNHYSPLKCSPALIRKEQASNWSCCIWIENSCIIWQPHFPSFTSHCRAYLFLLLHLT